MTIRNAIPFRIGFTNRSLASYGHGMNRKSGDALAFLAALMIVSGTGGAAAVNEASAPRVIPRVGAPPVLDADLSDPCWETALVISDFSQPQTRDAPVQPVEMFLGYDDRALYIAAIAYEANTNLIVATRVEDDDCVWCDDSIEIWIRDPLDRSRFDQFITSPLGTRETVFKRRVRADGAEPRWRVAAGIRDDAWVAELAIPFSDLGWDRAPLPGETIEIKLGREDYTLGVPGTDYAIWPAGVRYGARGDYGRMVFGRIGLLANPVFESGEDGRPRGWRGPEGFVLPVVGISEPTVAVQVPGRYTTLQQEVRLPPGRLFRLSAETRGESGGYLRARTPDPRRPKTTSPIRPTPDWVAHQVDFRTDPSGRATILIGCTDDDPPGVFQLRRLHLEELLHVPVRGSAIPVAPGRDSQITVQAIRVADARVVRGFCGAPVDGSLASWDWAVRPWEYNQSGLGTGIRYAYLDNDGLHITLADADGVNAIQVRGGVHARVVADVAQYDQPDSGRSVVAFEGRAEASLAYFPTAISSARYSFFDVRDGQIADLGFFRVHTHLPHAPETESFVLTAGAVPADLARHLEPRFATGERTVLALHPWGDAAAPPGGRIDRLALRAPVHLISAPRETAWPLSALILRAHWRPDADSETLLTVQVQDPVSPFAALMTATLALEGEGALDLGIDFPAQVLEPGQRLWVTLIPSGGELTLENPRLDALIPTRAEAVAEALPFQRLRMRDHFARMSEARPWTGLRAREDVFTTWGPGLKGMWTGIEPLFRTLAHCRWLDPDDPLTAEYDRWVHRVADRRAGRPVWREPEIPVFPGAPEWANVARAAWLAVRAVPEWWFEHRGVPTGELGTWFSDDTDFYQNMLDFPMFERDGVGGQVLDYGARLMQFTLDRGFLEEGLNTSREDPLHAYEEGINHQSVMPWWFYGDPLYVEQCMLAARSTEAWTTVNAAGHRHFKSAFLSSADLRNARPDEFDGDNHAQLMHPVQAVVWYNRNPRALGFLTEYSEAWHDHMQTPGAYATRVDTQTDAVLAHASEPYREGMGFQMSVVMTAAEALRDDRLLRPVIDFLERRSRMEFLRGNLLDLDRRGFLDGLADADDYLRAADPLIAWHRHGDKAAILGVLRNTVAEMQTFPNMYTTAEPFTDRVFLNHSLNLTAPAVAYTGGYATRNKSFHSHAVSWEGFGTDYAALVRRGGYREFDALLYNFRDESMEGLARFWLLDHGRYRLLTGIDSTGDDQPDTALAQSTIEVVRGDAVTVRLPPRAVTVLRLELIEPLDDLFDRPDLAVAARALTREGRTVRGLVHNLGNQPVARVVVALQDAAGVEQARAELGPIEAPLDLYPRRLPFALEIPATVDWPAPGWRIVVDPDGTLAEITRRNNVAEIP